jgi:hypothetical protein
VVKTFEVKRGKGNGDQHLRLSYFPVPRFLLSPRNYLAYGLLPKRVPDRSRILTRETDLKPLN